MGLSIKKNITIPEEDFKIIEKFSKKSGKSFSEFLRFAAKEYIKIQENLDLKEFLLEHCEYASKEEEEEILKTIKELDSKDKGKSVRLDELLWGTLSEKSWKMAERKQGVWFEIL